MTALLLVDSVVVTFSMHHLIIGMSQVLRMSYMDQPTVRLPGAELSGVVDLPASAEYNREAGTYMPASARSLISVPRTKRRV